MELIDIGANLTHDSFDHDRDALIARARAAGVISMIVTGSSADASADAARLAREYPDYLYATAGVHPHHAKDYRDNDKSVLTDLLQHSEVVAVGECGLDYFRNFSPPDVQRDVFREQLEIAVNNDMPVFLHQRDAHEDFVSALKDYLDDIPRAVAHCFTGNESELCEYLELGLYVGITGWICDERRGGHLRDLVKLIPSDRLLIETDAPYLLPRDLRPKPSNRRNEPANLLHIASAIADAAGTDVAELAAQTTENARRFFDLDATSRGSAKNAGTAVQ